MKFYIILKKINNKEVKKFIKFLLAGLPSALLAIPLNIILVEIGEVNKTISYGFVIFLQILVNFIFINNYVFKYKNNRFTSFIKFFFGIVIFRAFDLIIYSQLINLFPKLYILIQLSNIAIFSMIKFKYSKFILN